MSMMVATFLWRGRRAYACEQMPSLGEPVTLPAVELYKPGRKFAAEAGQIMVAVEQRCVCGIVL